MTVEIRYLDLDDLLHIAERTLGGLPGVRDAGLLESAVQRPRMSVFGADAYASLEEKAAALLHSVVKNHALVDGNKRLAFAAMLTFLGINGRRLTSTNDAAYDFVVAVASGQLDEIADIAARIRASTEDW